MPKINILAFLIIFCACQSAPVDQPAEQVAETQEVTPEYFLDTENTHNKFSRSIPPTLTVPSGAVVEVYTKEASDGQFSPESTVEDVLKLSLIHI